MHFCMDRPPDWDLYRSFLAVVEAGSLSGAARKLGIAQPTVGRHIEALEEDLRGVALFTRSPGGLIPTEAALALKPHAETMAIAAEALIRTASGEAEGESGTIRLTASEVAGVEILPPILTAFREAHPRIDIELSLSNRAQDLLRREADIAVRMMRPTQDALLAKRIGEARVGLFASRSYVEKHGAPQLLSDSGEHTAIGYDRDSLMAAAIAAINMPVGRDFFNLRTDSDLAQLAMMRAGFGISGCQLGIARRYPDLIQVLPQIRFGLEVWVVMHEDLKSSRRMRAMFDHLVEHLTAYVAGSQE